MMKDANGNVATIVPQVASKSSIAKGANGVILYTTKKGTSGSSGRIEVDVKYGANMRLLPMYDFINDPQQYVEL